MKKSSLLISAFSITAIAGIIFAQAGGATTVLTVVEKMKAASHDFTLTSELNAGQTDFTSGPLSGKKTGGIVTAEEYNRILEMLSEGGGGGGNGGNSGIKVASGQNVVGPDVKLNRAVIDLATYGFDPNGPDPHIIVSENNYNYSASNGNTMDASQCGFTKLSKLQFRTECMASTNDSSDWVQSTFDWLAIQVGTNSSGGTGGGGTLTTETVRVVCPTGITSGCAANCPAGTKVVGGGVEWLSTTGTCHVATSYPKENGWFGNTSRTNSDTTSCGAAVHAVCASVSGDGVGNGTSSDQKIVFNGTTGTVVKKTAGISGVTRNTTGRYTINFTTPMANTNYLVTATSSYSASNNAANTWICGVTKNVSSVGIDTCDTPNGVLTFFDSNDVNVVISSEF